MSNIGLAQPVAEHGEMVLVRIEGYPGGRVCHFDDDAPVLRVPEEHMDAATQCFPLLVRAYEVGRGDGEVSGGNSARFAIRKALGVTP